MKKLAASLGLFAVGASALHAVESSALNSNQRTKAWSVSASLKGFYDDNVGGQPKSANPVSTFGTQLGASVDYGIAGEQTSFDAGYRFTSNYYDKRPPGSSTDWDFTHVFDANLNHAFSSRVDVKLSESFVIGQEPDLFASSLGSTASSQRVSGQNVRNYVSASGNFEATSLLGFNVGYNNTVVDYEDPGFSATLDRMEHGFHIDSNWTLTPQTVGVLGYGYSQTDYSRNRVIGVTINGPITSSDRNSSTHRVYVGAQHVFNATLSGMVNVGVERTEYPNDNASGTTTSPYVVSSVTYKPQATTSLNVAFSLSRSASDVVDANPTSPTFVRDTEVALVSASLSHDITADLTGSASVSFQNQKFNGGFNYDGKSQQFLMLGLNLAYKFTPNITGDIGYNFDKLSTDTGRDYNRNKVYLGVTAGF